MNIINLTCVDYLFDIEQPLSVLIIQLKFSSFESMYGLVQAHNAICVAGEAYGLRVKIIPIL